MPTRERDALAPAGGTPAVHQDVALLRQYLHGGIAATDYPRQPKRLRFNVGVARGTVSRDFVPNWFNQIPDPDFAVPPPVA